MLDTSDDRVYSLKKQEYPRLPLFDPNAIETKRHYLNEVFLLVLDDFPPCQSINTHAIDTAAQMQLLASAEHPAIPATPAGPALIEIPKISKTLVSYIVGLMITTPDVRANCDEGRYDLRRGVSWAMSLRLIEMLYRKVYISLLKKILAF